MKLHREVDSAMAMCVYHAEVLLPPFDQRDGATLPMIRWWEKAWDNVETQVQQHMLTEKQAQHLADCVKDVQIASLYATSAAPEVCDGWTTKLSIAAHGSALQLKWFCDPPAKWGGVGALCEAIDRALFDLQRESATDR